MPQDEFIDDRLQTMFKALDTAKAITQPSQYWVDLNQKNIDQLKQSGYQNFKQTVTLNYFMWIMGLRNGLRDRQMRFLVRHTPLWDLPSLIGKAVLDPKHFLLSRQTSLYY